MKYKVLFFTRSNTSQRIAEKISKKLSCGTIQITDNMNWGGFFGFMKAGFYSSVDKHVDIDILGEMQDADEIILVTPLWAGGIAPAARTFLKIVPREKVHLVVSSDGSVVKDRSGFQSVTDFIKNRINEDEAIQTFVKSLKNSSS